MAAKQWLAFGGDRSPHRSEVRAAHAFESAALPCSSPHRELRQARGSLRGACVVAAYFVETPRNGWAANRCHSPPPPKSTPGCSKLTGKALQQVNERDVARLADAAP